MTLIDQPTDIREGEALDPGVVDRFMKEKLPELSGEPVIRQYPAVPRT